MRTRHLMHGQDKYCRRRKGSSDDRLNAEASFAQEGKHIIRQRGHKKLWSRPRDILLRPAVFEGKWNGYEIRAIRFIKGVGRPPSVLFKRAQKKRLVQDFNAQQWGF